MHNLYYGCSMLGALTCTYPRLSLGGEVGDAVTIEVSDL